MGAQGIHTFYRSSPFRFAWGPDVGAKSPYRHIMPIRRVTLIYIYQILGYINAGEAKDCPTLPAMERITHLSLNGLESCNMFVVKLSKPVELSS